MNCAWNLLKMLLYTTCAWHGNPNYYSVTSNYFEEKIMLWDKKKDKANPESTRGFAKGGKLATLRFTLHMPWRLTYVVLWQMQKNAKIKRRKSCVFSTSNYTYTFLQGKNLESFKIILLVNHWDHETVTKCIGMSKSSSVHWGSFCLKEPKIGYKITTLKEIDETLLVRRKYNRTGSWARRGPLGMSAEVKRNSLCHSWIVTGVQTPSYP